MNIPSLCGVDRSVCGLSRSYRMAGLCTDLLEVEAQLRRLLNDNPSTAESEEEEPEQVLPSLQELQDLSQEVNSVVDLSTTDHALLTHNWEPAGQRPDILLVQPGYYRSHIAHGEGTPTSHEQAVWALLSAQIELPEVPASCPYPLCEIAITLRDRIDQLITSLNERILRQQNALRRRYLMHPENEEALEELLQRTSEAGLMTASGEWQADVTRAQQALWIDLAARRLHISQHWRWARERWGLTNLAQEQTRNNAGQHVPRRQLIEGIFQ